MLLGKLPPAELLQAHGLGQYEAIAAAMRSGSIGTLNAALLENQRRFIMDVSSLENSAARCVLGP